METDKKQEFKDFSLSKDVLINELNDEEITKVLKVPKKATDKNKDDELVIVERFVEAAIENSQRGRTENQAATYTTSNDPTIDFFFQVMEDTDELNTIELLEKSWNYNCLDTLRMIAHLRDIRNGKGIRYQYYVCLYWIYLHHPRTLLQNFNILIDCGYWKDPFQLLMIILFQGSISKYLFDEEGSVLALGKNKAIITDMKKLKILRKNQSDELEISTWRSNKGHFYTSTRSELSDLLIKYYKEEIDKVYKQLYVKEYENCSWGSDSQDSDCAGGDGLAEECDKMKTEQSFIEPEKKVIRDRHANEIDPKYLKELMIRYARERFNNDLKYRYFHLKIAEMIAKQLIEDTNNLKSGNGKKISLAAKWTPSLNGHFDKYTLITSSIALQIAKITRAQDTLVEEIFTKPIPIATYLARKNYVKNYVVKLRSQLRIPESYMCKNQWNELPYIMVPSKCMQKNRKSFIEHDNERFTEFVKSREKISGATLKPPELVRRATDLINATEDEKTELEKELLEKQWISLKDSIQIENKDTCFKSSLAVCDVSGSMHGTPMEATIGLTIMTMSFCSEPWSNLCLTFSQEPQFVHFEKNQTLYQKVKKLRESDSGLNTDIGETFKLILELAKKHDLKQSEMPKYLFVFTDMEFDQADEQGETNFEEAKHLFTEAGYELPTMIFWNLRNSKTTPVQKDERGTILLSGYSAHQLSLLLNMKIEDITPFMFIEEVITMKKYEDLVVID